MKTFRRIVLVTGVGAIIFACSPDPGPFFTPPDFPENPKAFAAGHLGLLTPRLNARDELRAYRLMNGSTVPAEDDPDNDPNAASGWKAWDDARKSVLGSAEFVSPDKAIPAKQFEFFTNCNDSSFETAAATLNNRKTAYKSHDELLACVRAQDQVFGNCSNTGPIPDRASGNASIEFQQDRAYQIGAAQFYALQFDEAQKTFSEIARDRESLWQRTSQYMICRVEMRRAALLDSTKYAEARDCFLKISANQSFGSLASSARGLAQRIAAIQNPAGEMQRVANVLDSKSAAPGEIKSALDGGAFITHAESYRDLMKDENAPAPFHWINVFGRQSANPERIAWSEWQKTHSLPWFAVASAELNGDSALAQQALQDADKIDPKSAAYETVSYNAVRLLIEQGKDDEARRRADALVARKEETQPSLIGALRAERMRVATDFHDMLRWAPRVPVDAGFFPDSAQPALSYDSAHVLNFDTPLTKLTEAARAPELPKWSAADVAIATWVRAFIVGDDAVVKQVAPLIAKDHPGWADSLTPSADREQWRFKAALLISLRSSFQPKVAVNYATLLQKDGDWWCSGEFANDAPIEPVQDDPYSVGWKLSASFKVPERILSASEQAQARSEVEEVAKAGSAQEFLASIFFPYAKAHPDDAEVPHALHRLVMVVRYGCSREDPKNLEISKTAFDILHTRYPNSEWTKKTPYYFK